MRPHASTEQLASVLLLALLGCGSSVAQSPSSSAAPSASSASAAPVSDGTARGADGSPPSGVRQGSTVVLTPEEDVAIVADEDHRSLEFVALPIPETAPPAKRIEVPGRPASLVMLGKTLLVTLRETESGEGALVAYDRPSSSEVKEAWRVALPADAWGLAVTPDGAFAAVTSAWTAKVSLVDLKKHELVWTRDVDREPRGLAFTPDGDSLFVTHIVEAPITRIDKVHGEASVKTIELPASPERSPAATKLTATLAYAIVVSPDGRRAFVPRHALGTVGSFDWNGAATVDAFDVASNEPIATARQVNAHETNPTGRFQVFEYQGVTSDDIAEGGDVFLTPRAAVYRKNRRSLLVADEARSEVVELDALMSDPSIGVMHKYATGSAPSGIALSADENTAYVHSRASDTLNAIPLAGFEGTFALAYGRSADLVERAGDEKAIRSGRAGFYAACASCHPEGRDDGHVWHEVHFGAPDDKDAFETLFSTATAARHLQSFSSEWEGRQGSFKHPDPTNMDASGAGFARQTPMIVGRVAADGPYGWHGGDADLPKRIQHGFALHRWPGGVPGPQVDPPDPADIVAFIRKGLVPPPGIGRPLNDEEKRGEAIFTSAEAQCATCHAPSSDYTNRSVVPMPAPTQPSFSTESDTSFKTPSLLFVGGSPPYMHDGRYTTLDELIDKTGDRMGKTSQLSAEQKKALVAFLRTL